ncbi:MAG: 5-methyltetrahydropteroyltriglutamate--homocysteine S-methyltransferase [Chloroflexota bacterium]
MSQPAYRADHVGSLLRPQTLLDARAAHAAGNLSAEDLGKREDEAILEVLALQKQLGLDVVTDGEYRRGTWLGDMAEAVEGFQPASVMLEWHGPGGGAEASTSHIAGAKLRQRRRLTAHESGFLKGHAPAPYKMTMPAPSVFQLSSYQAGVTDKVYPTRWDLLEEVSAIVRDEVQALVSDGASYVQFDDAFMAFYLDQGGRQRLHERGIDLEQSLQQGIRANNKSLAGADRGRVTIGFHICRGNSKSRWFAEGGYDAIAEQVFGTLDVDRFLLEYDDPARTGGFEPLRVVPRGKTVVLGLISTKLAALESQDELRRRIDEAAKHVPLENLALSPQCGFASVAAGNAISLDDQRRKLELLVETARKVWG